MKQLNEHPLSPVIPSFMPGVVNTIVCLNPTHIKDIGSAVVELSPSLTCFNILKPLHSFENVPNRSWLCCQACSFKWYTLLNYLYKLTQLVLLKPNKEIINSTTKSLGCWVHTWRSRPAMKLVEVKSCNWYSHHFPCLFSRIPVKANRINGTWLMLSLWFHHNYQSTPKSARKIFSTHINYCL